MQLVFWLVACTHIRAWYEAPIADLYPYVKEGSNIGMYSLQQARLAGGQPDPTLDADAQMFLLLTNQGKQHFTFSLVNAQLGW